MSDSDLPPYRTSDMNGRMEVRGLGGFMSFTGLKINHNKKSEEKKENKCRLV